MSEYVFYGLSYIIGTCRLDYEYEVEYEYDFSIVVLGFILSCYIPISSCELLSLPKTNMKNKIVM